MPLFLAVKGKLDSGVFLISEEFCVRSYGKICVFYFLKSFLNTEFLLPSASSNGSSFITFLIYPFAVSESLIVDDFLKDLCEFLVTGGT